MSDKPPIPAAEIVRAYHARTKHRFEAYAEGPGQLDWDAQPAPFRHYAGAPVVELPLTADRFERAYGRLAEAPENPVAADLASLGALLELAFGISAWKSWGPNRWALRCNPSSGNLHPVEAYLLSHGLPGLGDGVHHYDPEQHALEGRAQTAPGDAAPWLAVGLSSVMWREAWKYGERAFRYCQLDIGHAIGALSYAAALLGWRVRPLTIPDARLAHALGIDRPDDFPPSRYAFTENEEPEILLAIEAAGLGAPPADVDTWLAGAVWHGQPSCIDPSPGYRWPAIDQVAAASRRLHPMRTDEAPAQQDGQQSRRIAVDSCGLRSTTDAPEFSSWPPLPRHPSAAGVAELIRQRRSAQRFDPQSRLPKTAFYRLLDALLPRLQAPWTAQETPPRIHLLLFVLRVDGLSPGLYLLPRTPAAAVDLSAAVADRFAEQRPVADFDSDCPPHLGLIQLAESGLPELQRLARALSCHQDIAATSAFSLGMLGEFAAATVDGHGYRALLREAGLLGQSLYLEAEAAGVRGTGIGCFFDDPVHQVCGLDDERWQSVYHFTVGSPISDTRIETGPPYPQRQPTP